MRRPTTPVIRAFCVPDGFAGPSLPAVAGGTRNLSFFGLWGLGLTSVRLPGRLRRPVKPPLPLVFFELGHARILSHAAVWLAEVLFRNGPTA